jgi:hypothetical protein
MPPPFLFSTFAGLYYFLIDHVKPPAEIIVEWRLEINKDSPKNNENNLFLPLAAREPLV